MFLAHNVSTPLRRIRASMPLPLSLLVLVHLVMPSFWPTSFAVVSRLMTIPGKNSPPSVGFTDSLPGTSMLHTAKGFTFLCFFKTPIPCLCPPPFPLASEVRPSRMIFPQEVLFYPPCPLFFTPKKLLLFEVSPTRFPFVLLPFPH